MARNKPYTLPLMGLDIFLSLITGGGWLLIVLFREIYRHQ